MSLEMQEGQASGSTNPFASAQSGTSALHGGGMSDAGEADASGPFGPGVNAMLSQAFGQSLSDLSVARGEGAKNRKISADAHTIGKHISLGDHIKDDPSDLHSMEVIAHEVSHALANGGSGQHIINRADDPGEHAAYDAGRQFKSFLGGGAKAGPPKLKPAHGGRAAIHRFEGGEHKNAVDGALELLAEAKDTGKANAVNVDPKVANEMKSEITLANRLTVSPGDITAMMGDFYGAFNEDGTFNPEKSFEALNDPNNAKEMKAILGRIHAEEESVKKAKAGDGTFQAASAKDLEELTLNRKKKPDKDGTLSGLSMLELAERNNSHFNKKDSSGTDNNMGAYESFHMMALEAAKSGNENLARAYEASAMHFLTDRHAGGHQFDKAGVQQAYKDGGAIHPLLTAVSPALETYDAVRNGDTMSQAATHIVHDHFNESGVNVKNAAGDDPWLAKGDKHWADKDNATNRFQTAKSVYSSYSELEDVLARKRSPEDVKNDGFKAGQTVPQFSEANQKKAEEMASKLTVVDVVKEEKENLGILGPFLKRKLVNAKNWVGDKWDGAKEWAGEKWNAGKEWAGDKWDGAKEWAGEKWNAGKEWAGDKWNSAKEIGGQAVDYGKEKLGNAWSGAKNVAAKGKETLKSGWGFLKNKLGF